MHIGHPGSCAAWLGVRAWRRGTMACTTSRGHFSASGAGPRPMREWEDSVWASSLRRGTIPDCISLVGVPGTQPSWAHSRAPQCGSHRCTTLVLRRTRTSPSLGRPTACTTPSPGFVCGSPPCTPLWTQQGHESHGLLFSVCMYQARSLPRAGRVEGGPLTWCPSHLGSCAVCPACSLESTHAQPKSLSVCWTLTTHGPTVASRGMRSTCPELCGPTRTG